ncbi:hypothetical protein ACFX15_029064 [Malus domestica]
MAIPHLHSVQSVRVSSPCRISFPNQYHYGRSNLSRKSSSLIYASTSNFDRDLHLQLKIIYLGKLDGPTCHTGSEIVDNCQRKEELEVPENGKPSWTHRLLSDEKLLCSKTREEADELCQTLEENEDRLRVASEMADVLYHGMALLACKIVKMEEVLEILRRRFS